MDPAYPEVESAPPAGSPAGMQERPLLPDTGSDSGREADPESLNALRHFHLSLNDEPGSGDSSPEEFSPALLYRFKDASRVRTNYPLYLYPSKSGDGERLILPLSELLSETLDSFAPNPGQARILRDNLLRLERDIREALYKKPGLHPAGKVLAQAGEQLKRNLSLAGENAENLGADLETFLKQAPQGGWFLSFTDSSSLRLLIHAAHHKLNPRRAAFRDNVKQLRHHLKELLTIERHKGPASRMPEALRGELGGTGADFVDPRKLSSVLGSWRGAPLMAPERKRRIEHVLGLLESYLAQDSDPIVAIVHDGSLPLPVSEDECNGRLIEEPDPCAGALIHFQRHAAQFTEIFRAVRIATLEIEGSYHPEHHDPWFAEFDWESFSKEEFLLLPVVIALESSERLAGKGMLSLSQLILSGKPIQVLVPHDPAQNPAARGQKALHGYHLELGFLGIGHREALVQQSSAARPDHLMEGYLAGLAATHASLHLIACGFDSSRMQGRLDAWLHAGAAIESRAHPLFRYNPESGSSWASRLHFSGNPNAEENWSIHNLTCRKSGGEEISITAAFTFADFALLEPDFRRHFKAIPEPIVSEDLVSIADYLDLERDEAIVRIPFVWGVDHEGRLQRLAITRRLALACKDRLDYWRTLQELAGIRNEYVREATRKAQAEAEAKYRVEREQLQATHADELKRMREEAASEAMGGLAAMLLDLDAGAMTAPLSTPRAASPAAPARSKAPTAPAPSDPAEAETRAEAAGPAEAEEDISFDEPWVGTPLCTSCNDCTVINPLLFVYDENKQVRIGDPHAGTFAQLVAAAEKCPGRCIHPGKPLNPDEPNLEDLIRRAEPFNV
ncbi:MAG: ferredoxin [Candidatus Eisenbacteria bacterium]|uniref:Ferredoxin n=1 Tax=Eiseniibacteriota bacterium TaxID=2212470 RepID=A0A948RVE7_UNCEI|nr:ferredoxin [Candidatus Eisenbacteria bacterium]MBU1950235.1 ferredoxin [Candidatus Eisenbacteria bacterium]MBU2690691.1 ferredoxin [Candidatus Eisenbacteria bacterium]